MKINDWDIDPMVDQWGNELRLDNTHPFQERCVHIATDSTESLKVFDLGLRAFSGIVLTSPEAVDEVIAGLTQMRNDAWPKK